MRRVVLGLVLVAMVALMAGAAVWVLRGEDEAAVTQPSARTSSEPAAQRTGNGAVLKASTSCPARVAEPFTPRTISIPGVTGPAPVIAPPRDAAGVPGIPPLTSAGKWVFAWDREQGISPGDRRGNVLLNAHTWPDGTALGNRLLERLDRGDPIRVRGGRSLLCYRVTERVEVLAQDGLARYYATGGRPQLAIVVCSGRRLGPGVWEKRTIWFASPGGSRRS